MDAVQEGLDRAGSTVKERLSREDGTTDRIVDLNKAGSDVGDAASDAAEAAERTLSDLSDAVPEVPRTP